MANLTFSNNGVPMGRNKSVAINQNAQWSEDEDNFLRMAAAQNMSSRLVASKLGRTPASVYTRKWQLDIRNDKSVPRVKAPRATKVVRTRSNQEVKVPNGIQLFKLESGIPVPARGSRGNEQVKAQIRKTFTNMEVGQSFVINREVLNSTLYIAKNEFVPYLIKTSATSADKKFYRIFRVR